MRIDTRKTYILLVTVAYMTIVNMLCRNIVSFQEYANRISESKLGFCGIIISFVALLVGAIEILSMEFKKLYTVEYYCCFNRYKGLFYALKKKYVSFLILELTILLFMLVFNKSFWLQFLLSHLVAITIFVGIYVIVNIQIKSDRLGVLTSSSWGYDVKNISWGNVIYREIIEKIKTYDAMLVRIIIWISYLFLNSIIEGEKGTTNLLVISLFLISTCGERYIKKYVQTIIYLSATTNRVHILLSRLIWTDCLINNVPITLITLFTPLGIKGGILAIALGYLMTIYWDIIFLWIYTYDFSVGVVVVLELMAFAIMLIPIANIFFCYKSYRKFSRRKEIIA